MKQTLGSLEKTENCLVEKSHRKKSSKKDRIEKDNSVRTCLLDNLFKNFPFSVYSNIDEIHIGTTQLMGHSVILSLL